MVEKKKETIEKKEEKEVVVKETSAVASTTQSPRGFDDGDDRDDLIIPRAKLLQQMSPEIVDEVEGLKVGDIINSVTKEKLPETFIPILRFKNWIRFNPRKSTDPGFDKNCEAGVMIWRSDDPRDPKVIAEAVFGPNGERPLATTYMNFLCMFEGSDMPIIVSFSNTSYKTGKKLYSLAKFAGVDMFARKYRLSSKKEAKDDMKYCVLEVNPAGDCSQEELTVGLNTFESMKTKKKDIQIHDENDEQVTRAKDEVYAEPVGEEEIPF